MLKFPRSITGALFGSYVPGSMKNVVFTFKTDNTFTETGAKTASGSWAIAPQPEHTVSITTDNGASKIDWSYTVSATSLELSNKFLTVTYSDPLNLSTYYVGEELSFTH